MLPSHNTEEITHLRKTYMMAGTFLSSVLLVGAIGLLVGSSVGYNKQPASHAEAASPSGQAMPVGDLDGWQQSFTEDFMTDAPLGTFQTKYAAQWNFYLDGWKDTAGQNLGAPSRYYPSKVLSASGGVLNKYLHTENGTPMAAALLPKIPAQGNGHQLYGKYTIRFKSDSLLGFKTAWLLWPDSGVWPRDGEVDYPEGDLSKNFGAFIHRQGATTGSDQTAFSNLGNYLSWHTTSLEWLPGRINLILDGVTVGTSTNRIPNTSMHWVIQTESCLPSCPAANVAGNLQIDWVVMYAYSPTTKAPIVPTPTPTVSPSTPTPTAVPSTRTSTPTKTPNTPTPTPSASITSSPSSTLPTTTEPIDSNHIPVGASPTDAFNTVVEKRKDLLISYKDEGKVTITAPVTGTQVKSIQVNDDYRILGKGSRSVAVDTTVLSEGAHSLTVTVTDTANVQTEYIVEVTIHNYHGFWQHFWYTVTFPWHKITNSFEL